MKINELVIREQGYKETNGLMPQKWIDLTGLINEEIESGDIDIPVGGSDNLGNHIMEESLKCNEFPIKNKEAATTEISVKDDKVEINNPLSTSKFSDAETKIANANGIGDNSSLTLSNGEANIDGFISNINATAGCTINSASITLNTSNLQLKTIDSGLAPNFAPLIIQDSASGYAGYAYYSLPTYAPGLGQKKLVWSDGQPDFKTNIVGYGYGVIDQSSVNNVTINNMGNSFITGWIDDSSSPANGTTPTSVIYYGETAKCKVEYHLTLGFHTDADELSLLINDMPSTIVRKYINLGPNVTTISGSAIFEVSSGSPVSIIAKSKNNASIPLSVYSGTLSITSIQN